MIMPVPDDTFRVNSLSWSYANQRFNRRKGDYANAIRRGRNLPQPVLNILQPGRADAILHLLCNDGREAATVTYHSGAKVDGVDFSLDAIDFARRLNSALSQHNNFTNAEAHSYLVQRATSRYNKILLTLGSIRWLPDLPAFFKLCARRLPVGGHAVIWDFHPLVHCLDEHRELTRDYPVEPRFYRRHEGVRDYVGTGPEFSLFKRNSDKQPVFRNPHPVQFSEYSCAHLIDAALSQGFALDKFEEYSFSWEERCFTWLLGMPDGTFSSPPGSPEIPLTFAVRLILRHPASHEDEQHAR